jgi:succinyl-diaminopimelate desuccinylase
VSAEVVEFGPPARAIHGIDEHVRLDDIAPLSTIYERALAALLTPV